MKLSEIKSELLSYSKTEKLFILFAMICSFCITSEYAITKPTSNSIFIAHYTVKLFPYTWLATVPLNFLIVGLYNRLLPRLGCFPLFLITAGLTLGINTLSGLFIKDFPPLSFFLYIWKDLYVLLMFQQLWSVIHAVTKMSRAKYLYGILFGIGGLGSMFGSTVPGFLAVKIGSEHLLFLTLPLYAIFIGAYYLLLKNSNQEKEKFVTKSSNFYEGFSMVRNSGALKFILLIVVLMQLSSTVMEYQFNTFLEQQIPHQDIRTEFYGRLWGLVNTINLCLQFVASFLLIHFLGLKKSHILIPSILLINAIGYLAYPVFPMIAYSFSVIKTFDYSIFNILKEMLYVPLKTEHKFKAKAIIDIFAYRSAKAGASLLIIAFQLIWPLNLPYAFSWAHIALFAIWIGSAAFFLKSKEVHGISNPELV